MSGPTVPIAFDDAPPSSTGSIPFMSFNSNSASSFDDLNQAAAGSQYMNHIQGQMSSHQSGAMCFENEPPLLEELGIDPKLVLKKSMEVLNPTVSHPKLLADGDISGLLLYGAALGVFHLLAGKVQFGDILGFSVLVISGIYWIVNCMAGEDEGNVELSRVSSMAGYSLLPIVAYAALCVVMPPRLSTMYPSVLLFCLAGMSVVSARGG
mmetsp:Transcript_49855/g.92875  ORF Transcript_49855/g.92875 Transcript_49855/m.92875 type:complete len:209 (-) Transcript_49855:1618-2244(-)